MRCSTRRKLHGPSPQRRTGIRRRRPAPFDVPPERGAHNDVLARPIHHDAFGLVDAVAPTVASGLRRPGPHAHARIPAQDGAHGEPAAGCVSHRKPGDAPRSVRLRRCPVLLSAEARPPTPVHERACPGDSVPGADENTRSRSETRLRGLETGCRARRSVGLAPRRRCSPNRSARS